MTATLEAIYKKGTLRLLQPIALPEGVHVYITLTDEEEAVSPRRYPSALEAQYQALITKELDRTLTAEEACRLQEVCSVIAEIDRLTPGGDIRVRQAEKLLAEMKEMRAELEALPDRPNL